MTFECHFRYKRFHCLYLKIQHKYCTKSTTTVSICRIPLEGLLLWCWARSVSNSCFFVIHRLRPTYPVIPCLRNLVYYTRFKIQRHGIIGLMACNDRRCIQTYFRSPALAPTFVSVRRLFFRARHTLAASMWEIRRSIPNTRIDWQLAWYRRISE